MSLGVGFEVSKPIPNSEFQSVSVCLSLSPPVYQDVV